MQTHCENRTAVAVYKSCRVMVQVTSCGREGGGEGEKWEREWKKREGIRAVSGG